MRDIGVILSTLWRPSIMRWFCDGIVKVTPPDALKFYFALYEMDSESVNAATELCAKYEGEIIRCTSMSVNRKVNIAYPSVKEPYVLFAADRIEFQDGWYDYAKSILTSNPDIDVVGLKDRDEPDTSSAFFIRNGYRGVIDEPYALKLINDNYDHNFADSEFKETAIHRKCFIQSPDSIYVIHHTGRIHGDRMIASSLFPQDKTNARAATNFESDSRLFFSREHLWK